jgi:hypothetical protein
MPGFAIPDDPQSWLVAADAMQSAAELIWAPVDASFASIRDRKDTFQDLITIFTLSGPALLLSGYCVENLLKGLCVKRILKAGGTPRFAARAPSSTKVWGHDLPALALSAGVRKGVASPELLSTLQQNIEWAGKYPIAGETPAAGFVPRVSSSDSSEIRTLVAKLRGLY